MIWSLLAPLWQAIKAPRAIAGLVIIGALILALLVQTVRIDGLRLIHIHVWKVDTWLIDFEGWKPAVEARNKQIAAMIAAQKTATTAQIAANHEPAAKSQTIAENSRDQSQAYYDEGRRAGLAYAAAHRVRPEAVGCPVSAPGVSGADRAAAVDDGPGDASDMVALSQADYGLLVSNSNRLAKVHQDADALIAAGVAVPLSKEH
jgi:hypothetical protein